MATLLQLTIQCVPVNKHNILFESISEEIARDHSRGIREEKLCTVPWRMSDGNQLQGNRGHVRRPEEGCVH